MLHRDGWRNGKRGREPSIHLSADRLADIIRALPAEPAEAARPSELAEPSDLGEPAEPMTGRLARGVPQRPQTPQPSHSSGGRAGELDRYEFEVPSSAAVAPVVGPPAAFAPVAEPEAALMSDGEPADAAMPDVGPVAATAPVVDPGALSRRTGRHRRRSSPKFRVWRFAFTFRRL